MEEVGLVRTSEFASSFIYLQANQQYTFDVKHSLSQDKILTAWNINQNKNIKWAR